MKHICHFSFAALLLLVSLLPAAFAASADKEDKHPLSQPKPDKALVYLVRQGEFAGGGRTEHLFVESTPIGRLPNNRYAVAYVEPGTHLLWGSFHPDPAVAELAAGQTYFLVFSVGERITFVPDESGNTALMKTGGMATMDEKDVVKAGKEGQDKWPKRQLKFANIIALGKSERQYVPPAHTDGLLKLGVSTPVAVELLENVTTATAHFGDPVLARAAADVRVDGKLVIRKGASVKAVIRTSKGNGSFGVGGLIDIAFLTVTTIDGTECPLLGQAMTRGKDQYGKATAAWVFFGIAGEALVKGKEGFRSAGEQVTTFSMTDVWIKPDSGDAQQADSANGQPSAQIAKATITPPLSCNFLNAKGPKKVHVVFDLPAQLAQVKLARSCGSKMVAPDRDLAATNTAAAGADFDGWTLCRYMQPENPETVLGFDLVTTDGKSWKADGTALLEMQTK